jgi:hypothetical protein
MIIGGSAASFATGEFMPTPERSALMQSVLSVLTSMLVKEKSLQISRGRKGVNEAK